MNLFKIKRLRTIFILYWFLLAYIIAALIWWFIDLNQQNTSMARFRMEALNQLPPLSRNDGYLEKITEEKNRKTAQYIGEGGTFLLLILAGAFFVFRGLRTQFRQSRQHQDFIMAITHELKTPIAITKLNLETLQKHHLPEEKRQRLLNNTIQETNRLNNLCNNMLLASQMEAGRYQVTQERINLSDLVENCVKDHVDRFPERIVIEDIEQDVYVIGDILMLELAVNNILDNAIKYSEKNTTIMLEVRLENEIVKVRITDEGKGIAAEEKKNIFMKFYRGDSLLAKKAKGTGIGLYLTKKIIEQHMGDIKVTDNVPRGSIFEICLSRY